MQYRHFNLFLEFLKIIFLSEQNQSFYSYLFQNFYSYFITILNFVRLKNIIDKMTNFSDNLGKIMKIFINHF